MDYEHAKQIRELLERNNLGEISPKIIDIQKTSYYYRFLTDDDDKVIACARIMEVQWYHWELGHVCVRENLEGKWLSRKIVEKAIAFAKENGALIVQCTIRENNPKSWKIIERFGFKRVNSFFNPISKNQLYLYQLNLSL